jgi:dsRNA-specific ribonuclease
VPLLCTTVVLTQAPNTDGWKVLKAALLEHLAKKSEDAVSLFAMAVQVAGWPNVLFDTTREGSDHAPLFTVTASDGTRTSIPIQAPTQKEAKQKSAVALLALCSDLPPPTGLQTGTDSNQPQQEAMTKKVARIDWSKDPIMALQEYSQALGGKVGPNYTFEMGGLSHLPVVTCTCKFGDCVKKATSGSKKDAKRKAAQAVADTVGKR